MATPNKLDALERERGDLHDVIPTLVNKHGQWGAAQQLNVSMTTISLWLKEHGYLKVTRYERQEQS